MIKTAEPWRLDARSVAIIDEVAARLEPDDASLAGWLRTYHQRHRARLAADLELLDRRVEPGARILEYGAIPLLMTGALARRGYVVHAVDVAPERFAAAIDTLGLEVVRCDVETEPVPFEGASFDAVLFNEIFEHLRIDPLFTLSEIRRVLRPSGRLFLSTPNLRSFRGLRNLILHNQGHAVSGGVYEQYDKLRTLGHMGHVREYTTREVTELLERLGFHVDELIYRGGHGRGVVGLAERIMPSMRPFFSLVATRPIEDDA